MLIRELCHVAQPTLSAAIRKLEVKRAYLVNTARGKICDRDAIVRALFGMARALHGGRCGADEDRDGLHSACNRMRDSRPSSSLPPNFRGDRS